MKLFDAHTHIQDERLIGLQDEVIGRSLEAGVEKIMCCGTCEGDWEAVFEMERRYPQVIVSLGLHPWFVDKRSAGWFDRLDKLIRETSACVGEIGLDRMIPGRSDKDQEYVFIEQLELANQYKRPVSIHCRKAWGVMPDLIKQNGGLPYGGLIHSWSGSAEMVKIFEKLGASISFSGSITRKNNKKAHQALKAVSRDRLLIESDSPDLLPSGINADFNEPSFITEVLRSVALIRGEKEEDLAAYTWDNALRLFRGSPA